MPYANPEVARARRRQYREANRERIRIGKKDWAQRNRARLNAQARARYAADPSKARENGRAWAAANKEKRAASNRRWYCPKRRRAKHLKQRFGVTLEQWDALFEVQGRKCATCPRTEAKWHTDHCHKTGRLRGILCHKCNLLLGYAEDNCDVLRSAINYLEIKPLDGELLQ